MSRRRRPGIVLGFCLLAVVALGLEAGRPSPEAVVPAEPWPIPEDLADGDLVFRRGGSFASRLVLAQQPGQRFSHVGMVLKKSGGLHVAHALPGHGPGIGGVQLEPLASFAAPEAALDLAFVQLGSLDPEARRELRSYLLQQIGRPFDGDFLLTTDESLYCTELVVKALAAAGVSLAEDLPRLEVMMLDEPVIVPEALWRAGRLLPESSLK